MEDRRPVSQDQFEGRNRLCDERFARDKERIEIQEENMRQVQKLTIEMAGLNKKHDDQLIEQDKRITCLERQPSDQYAKIKVGIATGIIALCLGYFFNAIVASVKP